MDITVACDPIGDNRVMYSLVRLLQPRWVRDRLKYMWCTHCAWTYSIDPQFAKHPTRELAQVIAAAWEKHDCGTFPKSA